MNTRPATVTASHQIPWPGLCPGRRWPACRSGRGREPCPRQGRGEIEADQGPCRGGPPQQRPVSGARPPGTGPGCREVARSRNRDGLARPAGCLRRSPGAWFDPFPDLLAAMIADLVLGFGFGWLAAHASLSARLATLGMNVMRCGLIHRPARATRQPGLQDHCRHLCRPVFRHPDQRCPGHDLCRLLGHPHRHRFGLRVHVGGDNPDAAGQCGLGFVPSPLMPRPNPAELKRRLVRDIRPGLSTASAACAGGTCRGAPSARMCRSWSMPGAMPDTSRAGSRIRSCAANFEGLRLPGEAVPFTLINPGAYPDASGKLALMRVGVGVCQSPSATAWSRHQTVRATGLAPRSSA